jgi:hypothetical protein
MYSPTVNGKWCFQKTLVLEIPCGRIQGDHIGINGVYYKLGEEIQRENGGHRWNPLAKRACFFSFRCF